MGTMVSKKVTEYVQHVLTFILKDSACACVRDVCCGAETDLGEYIKFLGKK